MVAFYRQTVLFPNRLNRFADTYGAKTTPAKLWRIHPSLVKEGSLLE